MTLKGKVSWLFASVAFLALAACSRSGDGVGGGQTVAQTPGAGCNLPNANGTHGHNSYNQNGWNTNCDPNTYNQYGWQSYPYGWSPNAGGFCGCPAGTRPVVHPQWGLGCAPMNAFQWSAYAYVGFGYQPQNLQWVNTNQVAYSAAVSSGNCYVDAARACDVRDPNACGGNGVCRATNGASTIGLCTRGYGNENYHQPRCQQYWNGYAYVFFCSNSYSGGYGFGGDR